MVEEGRDLLLTPDRYPTAFRSPSSGQVHILRRPEIRPSVVVEDLFLSPEFILSPEIQRAHELNQRVTGRTGIAVRDIMQTYNAYPDSATDKELQPQKDINDTVATKAMEREFDESDEATDVTTAEALKDIADGANIPHLNGVHGRGDVRRDAIVDPLEGTTFSVKKKEGVTIASALVEPGGSILIPDDVEYMQKLFAPMVPGLSLMDPADITISKVLHGLNIYPGQLRVTILDRPRNRDEIRAVGEMGVDLNLIEGIDLLASVMASDEPGPDGKYNMVMGIGGAPEGIIAAAAAKATGKTFVEARFWPKDTQARKKYAKVLTINDLISARADSIVVDLAHVTPDSKYAGRKGIRRLQNGHTLDLVDFTSVDLNGIKLHTRDF